MYILKIMHSNEKCDQSPKSVTCDTVNSEAGHLTCVMKQFSD